MWFDIDKVNLSEDHYENYFFWPLILWLECNFNNPANRANQEVLTVLKPTRVAEGRKYHSDLVVYGEYPFLLQFKPPIRDPKSPNVLKYKLTNQNQHNSLKDLARIYQGVFTCYALPILGDSAPRFPFGPSRFPFPLFSDLENLLWFVDLDKLPIHDGHRHHIEIRLQAGQRPTSTFCSEPQEIPLLSLREWANRLKERKCAEGALGQTVNAILKEFPSARNRTNILIQHKIKSGK